MEIFPAQDTQEDFGLIQPRGMDRRIVQGEPATGSLEGRFNRLTSMGRIVIDDHVELLSLPVPVGQALQAIREADLALAGEGATPGSSIMEAETDQPIDRPMPDVLVFPPFDPARAHRQRGKAAFQRLDGRFLVQAEDQDARPGQSDGMRVVPQDRRGFLHEVGGDLGLPVVTAVGLQR